MGWGSVVLAVSKKRVAEKWVKVLFQQQQLSAGSLLLVTSRSALVRGRPLSPLWFYSIGLR